MTSEATRQERLVAALVESGRIRSERVAAAMRAVPRHRFLPGVDPAVVYADEAVPTRWSADGRPTSSSSQPAVVAAMLEQLDVRPGHRVLEIGSGTGWNAALLAHLAGPTGAVTTIDIEPEVAAQALVNLGATPPRPELAPPHPTPSDQTSPTPSGPTRPTPSGPTRPAPSGQVRPTPGGQVRPTPGGQVRPTPGGQVRPHPDAAVVTVVCADGAAGHPAGAPYDRIILTAAARDLAPAWWDQLHADGRLVLPLSLRGPQRSVAFERDGDHLRSVSIVDCGFMPLQGLLAGVDPIRSLGRPGLFLRLEDPRPLDTARLLAALDDGTGAQEPLPVTEREALGGLRLWLALHDPDAGDLHAAADARPTPVLVGADSLAVLLPDRTVQGHGPHGDALAARLRAHVEDWIAAGRPSSTGLRIEAYRAGSAAVPPPPTLDLPHTRFAVYLGS